MVSALPCFETILNYILGHALQIPRTGTSPTFWVMSSSGFFMRSSMAQFDSVDFNCATAQAALLPITVDLAGHRIKKQAQPFAAPGFLGGTSLSGRSHFLCGRRFSSSAIHSNNCFTTGPSCKSFAMARLSLAQGLNGQTEAGYISSSCPILLETCRPFPSITAAKNRSLRVTIAFSTCAGSRRVTFVLFSEKARGLLLCAVRCRFKRHRKRAEGAF